MMLNFNSLMIFSEDPKKLADFYAKVFDKEKADWSDGQYHGFNAGKGFLTVGPHDKVHGKNTNPERMLINIETDDVKGNFERVKKQGATVIAEPYNPGEQKNSWIATLADPDGNYFQFVTPWEDMSKDK